MLDDRLNPVVVVDHVDRPVMFSSKWAVHREGILHRAFSVVLFRKIYNHTEILLQKRQKNKYHCPGLWSNTCCSHPAPGESLNEAASRRLWFEMGLVAALSYCGHFCYRAELNHGWIEHEVDHVFVGVCSVEQPLWNPSEVESSCWVEWEQLLANLATNSTCYTPWLAPVLQIACCAQI